jgi:hypothetical protein
MCKIAYYIDFSRQSVLQSVGDDQDRAIDVLLGMNDPTYVSTTSTHNVRASCLILQMLFSDTSCYN